MLPETNTIGFIGAGNMGTALIRGLLASGIYNRGHLGVFDKDAAASAKIEHDFAVLRYSSNQELVERTATVVLCVKPQQIKAVLEEIGSVIRVDQLLISVAAGVPLMFIRSVIGKDIPLIRVMPNTPALVQKGMSALAPGPRAEPVHMAKAKEIFSAVGETVEVDEAMMDAVTALSGSGPGYVFRMMECMVDAGVAVGLGRDVALKLVLQTFLGSAYLAGQSDLTLSQLREMVTSPGGTTAAGLETLGNMGLCDILRKTVESSWKRSIELCKDADADR